MVERLAREDAVHERAHLRGMVGRRHAPLLAGAARGMLAQADDRIIAALDKIVVPTLVLVGADDRHFLAAADYMARKIPGAARVTIPDAGHASNLHQPAAFNRAVEDFLFGLPS